MNTGTLLHKKLLILLAVILLLISCDNEDGQPATDPSTDHLIEATLFSSQSATVLKLAAGLSGFDIDPAIFKYDVKVYKVKYRTRYQNNDITASGLIILPQTSDPAAMISFQHGTIVANNEAPSLQSPNSTDVILYSAIASPGFIAVIPDYIGFGESSNVFHPYYVEEPTALAVTDMIKAAQQLASNEKINFNQKLFLAGYSQGGYATMAAHKAIEKTNIDGANLIASFPAAGGYDTKAMQEYFFSLTEYTQPNYLAYLMRSYQVHYSRNELLSDFFNEPYASRIPGLFNGTNSSGYINSQLTTNIPDLLTIDIRTGINTNNKYKYAIDYLTENSLTDWYPKTTMYLYHGDADTTVPYQNSVQTYQRLITNGASAEKLSLITLSGADHATGVTPYVEDFLAKVVPLK